MSLAQKIEMDKIKNLHSVSSVYFFILALTYVFLALALRNGISAEFALDLIRILDVPFAFVSLLYGFSTLALQLRANREEGGVSPWVLVILVLCLIFFGAVVFVNFAFPSQF